MVNHHSNGGGSAGNSSGGAHGGGGGGDYSGDDRSGGEERERLDGMDLHDKPTYLLEHLATFTVNKESGIVYPADGMRRLLQLEKTTGIWSQKMQLCLDYQWVLIMDYETGNIIERFPASLVQEPTAFTSNDAMELYNNILVFIVSGGGGSRSEMHIFQSQSVSAVHLVEDLKQLRSGKMITQQRGATPTQHAGASSSSMAMMMSKTSSSSSHSRAELHHREQRDRERGRDRERERERERDRERDLQHQHQQHHMHQRSSVDQYGMRAGSGAGDARGGGVTEVDLGHNGETDSEHGGGNDRDETSSTSSEKYERDVAVLNHCFDDIEKFIARLQHAAAASRELERRRRNRKSKKRDPGEGLLTLRTRPPHEKEFVDIFAKFKLSFNLLAKLKAHIHDPNAPELVHFLFTPLALIVEASSDTYYESQLPSRVINPLLTREAINLLINCVTSKETELWRSLGDAWVIPRDQWKEDVGSYHPVFLDGWSPDYLVIDELETPSPTQVSKRRLEVQAGPGHGGSSGLGLNGRGAAASAYDDYDTNGIGISLSEKYTIHHGNDRERDRTGAISASDFNARSELSFDSIERGSGAGVNSSSAATHGHGHGPGAGPTLSAITAGLQNLHTRDSRNASGGGGGGGNYGAVAGGASEISVATARGVGSPNASEDQLLEAWLEDLQSAGAKVVLVTYPRTANNDKELSVMRGEYLEILDDTRKWWKARNMRGQVAHVPHTIVTPFNYGDGEGNASQFYGQQQMGAAGKSRHLAGGNMDNANMDQRSPDATDMMRSKHLGKKGEFRYF
ncbi:epidermal growth factor receptor kinase substrate 8-like protein 1 [Drosophila sulfurigaster albostrigata]|uniref:epidermal growth factor receptor kinase substrate 8-like protein 1 n=1 Tax=Drosophila sulfurigaster albostrigata TaxID=89887 RepID=UPI002D21AC8D|nr:epidermal growth factor receptor kinase substrate 8-like protein 1 [Drosophila sulfurigaster albostrigata]XP_062143063.1 epidermal growth factor receptor kinase substrate 8-like protein 1 [Drosophila sulfurigaster albostrigata]